MIISVKGKDETRYDYGVEFVDFGNCETKMRISYGKSSKDCSIAHSWMEINLNMAEKYLKAVESIVEQMREAEKSASKASDEESNEEKGILWKIKKNLGGDKDELAEN